MEIPNSIPPLRFSGFHDKWNSKQLKDLGKVINGLIYSPNDIDEDGILVLRSSNIQNNNLSFQDNVYVKTNMYNQVIVNDILICVRNGSKKLIGKNALITKEIEGVAFGAFMSVYRSKYNKFIFQLFATEKYRKIIYRNLGATINSINNSEIRKFSFYFPSVPEQQKIASFLTSVDNKITQLTKKKALLERYKKGVMQQLFSQDLRFMDDTGNNFPNWEEKQIGKVAIINMGQSPNSSSYNSKGFGFHLIQGNADISNRKTSPRNWTSEPTKICEIGDIILTVRAPVGAVAKSQHRACIGRGVCSIKNKPNCNLEFLYQFLLEYERRWARLEQGSTFTAVSGKDIRSILIYMPSFKEQTKIANFLSAVDNKIAQVDSQIEKTTAFKKGLLQQMFV